MSKRRNERLAYFQGADEPVNTSDGVSNDKVNSNNPEKLGYKSKEGIQYSRPDMAVPVGGDSRDWEQNWFEGAAAETKKYMGPIGEEFDLKKHWLRIPEDAKIANAKVIGGFTKKANLGDSYWTLYLKGKDGRKAPILKASVKEIWGEKMTPKIAAELGLPKSFANKDIWTNKEVAEAVVAKTNSQEYFNNVAKDLKAEGFSAVAWAMTGNEGFIARAKNGGKVTKAQMLEGGPEMGATAPAELAPEEGLDGGVGETLDAEVENTAGEADATVELLCQKHEELEQSQTNLVEKTAPEETASVFMQLQDAEKMIEEAKKEMEVAAKMLRDKTITAAQKIKFIKLTAEAQEEAIDTMQAADTELGSAEEAIKKADEAIKASEEVAGGAAPAEGGEAMMEATPEAAPAEAPMGGEAPVAEESMSIEAALKSGKAADFVKAFLNKRKAERGEDNRYEQGKYQVHPDGAPKNGNDEINRAHPKGGHEVTDLTAGGKPENHGGRFDTVIEQHEHDEKVADKMPTCELSGPPVAVASTKKDPRAIKLAELIKKAEVDSATKDFWGKLLWGQSDGDGKAFGKELYENFEPGGNKTGEPVASTATASAVAAETQAKVVRAYELADEAVDKGFCERTAEAKSNLVKQVLAFDDKAFIAFKNVLDSAKKPTVASVAPELIARASAKLPRVGVVDNGSDREEDLVAKLTNLGWK